MSWRLIVVVGMVLASVVGALPAYAEPQGGTGIEDAVNLTGVVSGSLAAGQERWFKVWDNGLGTPLGVVLYSSPWSSPAPWGYETEPLVNFRVWIQVKEGLGWRSLEIGRGTRSGLSQGAKYWRGGPPVAQWLYLQVQNSGPWGADYAIASVGDKFPPPSLTISPAADPAALTRDIKEWVGQDTFIIDTGKLIIYTDPYRLKKDQPKADLILITHEHADHCSPPDLEKIVKPDTTIVAVAACLEKLGAFAVEQKVIAPYEKMQVKGVAISTIPAYNFTRFRAPGVPYHPKESGMVGFVFVANGIRYYLAGDTDNIEEMKGLAPDVAFVPVGGRYTMDIDEALEALKAINPKVAVPMHFGGSTGTPEDGDIFKSKASVPVVVFQPAP